MTAGMGSDLHLEDTGLVYVDNTMRWQAALTVCDRVADKWPAAQGLLSLGLIVETEDGYARAGEDDGLTWSEADRLPAGAARVRPAGR